MRKCQEKNRVILNPNPRCGLKYHNLLHFVKKIVVFDLQYISFNKFHYLPQSYCMTAGL